MNQHAGRDLVADLDHVGARAARDQLLDRVLRVVVKQSRQRRDRGGAVPGDGDALLAGVGPVVAVVEVDQQAHARVLDLLSEVDGVRDVVVAVVLVVAVGRLRIDERPQPDVVEAVRLHDRQQVAARGDGLRLLIGDVGADEEAERQRVHAGAPGAGGAGGSHGSGAACRAAATGSAAARSAAARRAACAAAPGRARARRSAACPLTRCCRRPRPRRRSSRRSRWCRRNRSCRRCRCRHSHSRRRCRSCRRCLWCRRCRSFPPSPSTRRSRIHCNPRGGQRQKSYARASWHPFVVRRAATLHGIS